MIFVLFQGYSDIIKSPFCKRMEIMRFDTHQRVSAIVSPYKCTQYHSSEGCLFSSKNLWHGISEGKKKQIPQKSNFLKVRIDSLYQILRNKEKVTQTHNHALTRITDSKIPWVYLCSCTFLYIHKKPTTKSLQFSLFYW